MMAAASVRAGKAPERKTGLARRRGLAILVGGVVAMATPAAFGGLGGLRINLTPSEPIGLWRIEAVGRPVALGDLVFVCPPPGRITAFGLDRGYFRQGSCPGGAGPLIKTVIALADAHIAISDVVMVDGVAVLHSRPSPRDGAGRALSAWSGVVVPGGSVFLHSPFAGSYDSRYFGPVPEAGLLGLARPVLTFDP